MTKKNITFSRLLFKNIQDFFVRVFSTIPLTLYVIFFIAFFLRVYHLGQLPGGFYVEEMTNTYVGKFILQHGKDLYGNPFPLIYFDKFNDYPPVLPLYLSGIGALIFGVNEFGGRFPVALVGALSVFPLFYITRRIIKSDRSGFVASFILAVAPWHIVLSRTTAEGIVGMFVLLYGLLYLLRAWEEYKRKSMIVAVSLLVLTYFLYPGLRVLVPMLLFIFPVLAWTEKKSIKPWLLAFLFCIGLTVLITLTPWGRARYQQTSLFSSPEIRQQIETRAQVLSNGLGENNVLRARIFHNKVVLYSREFIHQYLLYFSPLYLFYEAGGQFRYYNVPDQGLLYFSVIPLLLFAFVSFGDKAKSPLFLFVVWFLVVSPISSALTVDFPPHVHRSMFLLLPLILIAAKGYDNIIALTNKPKIIGCLFLLAIGIEIIYFWNQYAFHADKQQSILRNYGDKEIVQYIAQEKDKYTRVVAPIYERLPLYYAFYANKFDSSLIGQWKIELRIPKLDNIEFITEACPSKYVKKNGLHESILVIDNGNCDLNVDMSKIHEVKRVDSTLAYRVYEL